ncbi:hypothetical protein N657DRAFT_630523 [Parathielavia appendiculata]|uniref:Copper acquisition factor BIM1-like domain-containing protein n=1 Tax=Parathielavia appendiculata TaxID=2587402 RepID=A0AAN6UAY9_9PEZI|nr:hypothetical protein N657DRAFT_630523 [Parathielavia appendiculata]
MAALALLLLATASVTQAHFGIEYPPMRANTLGSSRNSSYSQWLQPCAGVPGNLTDRPITPWPLSGGSLKLDLHHPWTYIFINLGLGSDVSNFNYTLTNPFWNETGNGTLCVPKLALPADLPVTDGSQASLQVVTVGDDGNALYNCADIVFSANATALEGNACANSTGLSVVPVVTAANAPANGTNGTAKTGTGAVNGVNAAALSSVMALAMVFALGMSL